MPRSTTTERDEVPRTTYILGSLRGLAGAYRRVKAVIQPASYVVNTTNVIKRGKLISENVVTDSGPYKETPSLGKKSYSLILYVQPIIHVARPPGNRGFEGKCRT